MRQRNLFVQLPHREAPCANLAEYKIHPSVGLPLVGSVRHLYARVFLCKQYLCEPADWLLPRPICVEQAQLLQREVILFHAQALQQPRCPSRTSAYNDHFILFHPHTPRCLLPPDGSAITASILRPAWSAFRLLHPHTLFQRFAAFCNKLRNMEHFHKILFLLTSQI